MPFLSLWFKSSERYGYVSSGSPAYGELHDHYRKSHHDEEQQVYQNESGATITTCYIREAPYIAKSDCTSGG